MAGVGFTLLGVFVHTAMPVIFKSNRYLQAIARKSKDKRDYSFWSFGLFWGVSTTLIFYAISIAISDVFALARVFNYLGTSMQWVWVLYAIILFLPIIPIALFIVFELQFKVTAPLCCCGKESFAHKIVTCVALSFDMAAIQLLCHHVAVAILAIPAAPLIIVTFVLFFVLLGTCAIITFAFFWTAFAKLTALQTLGELYSWCKNRECLTNYLPAAAADGRNLPSENKYEDWANLAHALVLIPSLMAVVCFSALLAFSGKYVNTATRQDNFASLLLSVIIPLLLSGIVIGTQVFICKWLKIAQLFQQAVDFPYERKVEDSPQGQALIELS